MEAIVGALLLDPFCLGPPPHGDVQLDECLIVAGWWVVEVLWTVEALVVWGSHTC